MNDIVFRFDIINAVTRENIAIGQTVHRTLAGVKEEAVKVLNNRYRLDEPQLIVADDIKWMSPTDDGSLYVALVEDRSVIIFIYVMCVVH